jgi:uncharacterized protein YukE
MSNPNIKRTDDLIDEVDVTLGALRAEIDELRASRNFWAGEATKGREKIARLKAAIEKLGKKRGKK